MIKIVKYTGLILLLTLIACKGQNPSDKTDLLAPNTPTWAQNAIWYQIFPERFANGDSTNDPTRESLEFPDIVPENWQVSDWTADWYSRQDWEKQMGDDFYENGVFHRRYGGDLQGVLNRLDYLADLGINAIYFNPVFYAASMHKYDGNTYHHIDPYFGPAPAEDLALMATETADPDTWKWTEADKLFLKLLAEASNRNIRVVIDGVFNHTGRGFYAFQDLIKNQEKSPYKDWYVVNAFDDPNTDENEFDYEGWWGTKTLPLFSNTSDELDLHPAPKAYIFDATRRWMDPNGDGDPEDGIAGWRLDVTEDVPIKFWQDWNAFVREINPEAYTVTEIWGDASAFVVDGGFSATMNYHGFAIPIKDFFMDGDLSAGEFASHLTSSRAKYGDQRAFGLQNLMDSHDTDRLASMIVNGGKAGYDREVSPRHEGHYEVRRPNAAERNIQKMITIFQVAYAGAPMIYYGTEAGMWGADDPDDRMPMTWPEMTFDDQVLHPRGDRREGDQIGFDADLFAFYKAAFQLRKDYPVLSAGGVENMTTDDKNNFFSFTRVLGHDKIWAGFNLGNESIKLSLSSGPDSLGPDSLGPDSLGPDSLGPDSLAAKNIFMSSENSIRQDEDGSYWLLPKSAVLFEVN